MALFLASITLGIAPIVIYALIVWRSLYRWIDVCPLEVQPLRNALGSGFLCRHECLHNFQL